MPGPSYYQYPPPLQRGDTVALAAPARAVSEAAIEPARAELAAAGYAVRLAGNIGRAHGVLAGPTQERAACLQALLDDPNLAAIWFARGGYGSLPLLRYLDWSGFRRWPKWLIGYSDTTLLLLQALRQGIAACHGPVAREVPERQPLQPLLRRLSAPSLIQHTQAKPEALRFASSAFMNRPGRTSAPLVGGNLSTLVSLLGTRYEPPSGPMVLMLEEVDEYLYSLDRMLHKLAFSAWAQAAQAILIGSLSALQDNPEPFGYSLEGLVYEALGPLEVPLAWGLPIGHGPANQPLIVGAGVEVAVAGPAARLTLISG